MHDRDFQDSRQHAALASAMTEMARPRPAPQPIIPGLAAMGRALAASHASTPVQDDPAASTEMDVAA